MIRPVYQTPMSIKSTFTRLTPHLLSALRMAAAFLFIAHGTQKLIGFPVPGPRFQLFSMLGAAGIIETVGGVLMLLGLFTRPVAFILSGQMAVAYFTQHAPRGTWPIANGGELAALYSFLWLYFVGAGPGPWSVDRFRGRA
jgi:putative oxidoreductase